MKRMKSATIKLITQELSLPTILWKDLRFLLRKLIKVQSKSVVPDHQDLTMYWDLKMAQVLETWGEGNVWNEIQFFMSNCRGKVLDIACGTGKTIELNSKFSEIELYGCDISDFLIQKAVERGIPEERLKVCDATKSEYKNDYFNYAYSIGSLEHFTAEGIIQFISECHRIVGETSFHMVPTSIKGKDEGWIKASQSYYNNSVDWWLSNFRTVYSNVYVLDSCWRDKISVGKWFVCVKK